MLFYGDFLMQPVVDAFDPRLLISPAVSHTLDFTYIKVKDLSDRNFPIYKISFIIPLYTLTSVSLKWTLLESLAVYHIINKMLFTPKL